jgi:RNA polymerase sigma-70 factor (ECF subfamily)
MIVQGQRFSRLMHGMPARAENHLREERNSLTTPQEDMLSHLSDKSLLRRFRLGQEAAATELYRRYASRVHGLARRRFSSRLSRRVDADDIVQSVFCAFFQAVRKGYYDVPDGEDLWRLLLVIALNKVRSNRTFHLAARRDVRLTVPVTHLKSRKQAGHKTGMLLCIALDEALQQLEAPQRRMVELLIEGHEVSEIAAKLGRSKRTVERNLQEVRKKLNGLLEGEFAHAQ